jgi:hypothetical protein
MGNHTVTQGKLNYLKGNGTLLNSKWGYLTLLLTGTIIITKTQIKSEIGCKYFLPSIHEISLIVKFGYIFIDKAASNIVSLGITILKKS